MLENNKQSFEFEELEELEEIIEQQSTNLVSLAKELKKQKEELEKVKKNEEINEHRIEEQKELFLQISNVENNKKISDVGKTGAILSIILSSIVLVLFVPIMFYSIYLFIFMIIPVIFSVVSIIYSVKYINSGNSGSKLKAGIFTILSFNIAAGVMILAADKYNN